MRQISTGLHQRNRTNETLGDATGTLLTTRVGRPGAGSIVHASKNMRYVSLGNGLCVIALARGLAV